MRAMELLRQDLRSGPLHCFNVLTTTRNVVIPGCEQHKSIPGQNFHHILLGEDLVTAVRALSCQKKLKAIQQQTTTS